MRFTITWHANGCGNFAGYKVSIPQYDGGEVVTADSYDRLKRAGELMFKALTVSSCDHSDPRHPQNAACHWCQIKGTAMDVWDDALVTGLPEAAAFTTKDGDQS